MPISKASEAALESELVRQVRALGGKCEKVQVIGKRGWPDRFVVLPGGYVALVELKRPRNGVLSAHQKKLCKELTTLGVTVVVIRNQEQIERFIQQASHQSKRSLTL